MRTPAQNEDATIFSTLTLKSHSALVMSSMARLRATPRPRDFQHPRDPIRLLAQSAQPKLRKDIREAFKHLRAIVPVSSLAGAIRRGDPRHAAAALIDHWAEVLKGVFNRLGDIRFDAADLGARKITADFKRAGRRVRYVRKAIGDGFDFDRFDEDTLAALREAQDDLIADLSDQARDTVAYLIDRGVQAGDSDDEIAATIRDTISLTERQAQAVANYRTLLENADQGAIERELRNAEFDDAVQAAIDRGEPLADSAIDELVGDYADNYLEYRADVIARTESLRAANEGLRDGYRQAADRGVFPAEAVTRNWLAAIDERTCPICMSIVENNKDGVGLNDDFQSDDGAVDDPPVHANCRCTVEYVTNLDMLPDDQSADEEDMAA